MGKKKIGEIYNKPIVTGDKNLVTKNEIHESTLKGGTVDSGSSDVEYYATDMERLNLLGENGLILIMMFSLFKYIHKPIGGSREKYICGGWKFYNDLIESNSSNWLYAIAFSKIKYNSDEINTLKEAVVYYDLDISLFDSVFTPITKEEFYDLNSSDNSGESTVKEGDLIYYTLNDSFTSIGNITDNITQIAVGRGESMSSGSVGNLNRFVDIQDVTINKGESYVSISIPNFIVVDMPAFVYKVGSDLKTAEDIIGNNSITRITKEEYDNIFNV